jgi:fluoride exporter
MPSLLLSCVLVGVGGACGALARFGLSTWLQTTESFPWGTFGANLLGCLAIGGIAAFLSSAESLHETFLLPEHYRLLLAVGFCGGFTTFSTFVLEITAMMHRHDVVVPFVYFMATTIGGFACFYLGLNVMRLLVALLSRGSS